MNIVNMIQCRSESKRLPEKCFLKFGSETMIKRIYRIISSIETGFISPISIDIKTVVVIPVDDIKLYDYLINEKIPVLTGDKNDVLKRYYDCSVHYRDSVFDSTDFYIGRITADCPCPDISSIISMIYLCKDLRLDYISNFNQNDRTIVDGEDYEIISYNLLSWLNSYVPAENKSDREHVTSYLYTKEFATWSLGHPDIFKMASLSTLDTYNYSDIKTSIDTMEDYERVSKKCLNKI